MAEENRTMDWGLENVAKHLAPTLIYTFVGLAVFGVAFWIMCKVSPFSIQKEIEQDQNVALGVVMGAVILGIAIIVASCIAG